MFSVFFGRNFNTSKSKETEQELESLNSLLDFSVAKYNYLLHSAAVALRFKI